MPRVTYLMTQSDVAKALTMAEAVQAVEAAFRAHGEGKTQMPPKVYLTFDNGDLRSMPSYVPELGLAGVKNVNVHTANVDIPVVMATVTVFDPDTGYPLAIMDGTCLTAMRTGAAGGIAAKYLAREDSKVAGFVGAGRQAETQLDALVVTMKGIKSVLVSDISDQHARHFADWCKQTHGVEATVCSLEEAVRGADIVTTVTPVHKPIVQRAWVRPGTHINAIGADATGKQELESSILQAARVVVDNWEQSSHGGEINVAVAQGLIGRDDIAAEIGEVVCGRKKGRLSAEDITVFDSTGLAIQDVACAAHVYRRLTSNEGLRGALKTIDFLA
jgi:alanine dehydrogenase